MLADIVGQSRQARPFARGPVITPRKHGPRLDRPTAQVAIAALADGPVALEYQAQSIEPLVARGTALILAVSGQRLAQRQLAQLGLIGRQLGHAGGRGWDSLAQDAADDPIA